MRAGREAVLPEALFFFFGLEGFFSGRSRASRAWQEASRARAWPGAGGRPSSRGRRLLAGDSDPGVLARRGRRFLLLPGAFLGFSLGIRHAAGKLLVRDDRRLRKTLGHDVQAVRGDAQQIDRRVARLLGLGEIVGGLQGMRRRLREVDGDRVGFFFFRQLEEGRPARLGGHDVGPGAGQFLHPPVALGALEIEEQDAHGKGDYSRCQVPGVREKAGVRDQVSGSVFGTGPLSSLTPDT